MGEGELLLYDTKSIADATAECYDFFILSVKLMLYCL